LALIDAQSWSLPSTPYSAIPLNLGVNTITPVKKKKTVFFLNWKSIDFKFSFNFKFFAQIFLKKLLSKKNAKHFNRKNVHISFDFGFSSNSNRKKWHHFISQLKLMIDV